MGSACASLNPMKVVGPLAGGPTAGEAWLVGLFARTASLSTGPAVLATAGEEALELDAALGRSLALPWVVTRSSVLVLSSANAGTEGPLALGTTALGTTALGRTARGFVGTGGFAGELFGDVLAIVGAGRFTGAPWLFDGGLSGRTVVSAISDIESILRLALAASRTASSRISSIRALSSTCVGSSSTATWRSSEGVSSREASSTAGGGVLLWCATDAGESDVGDAPECVGHFTCGGEPRLSVFLEDAPPPLRSRRGRRARTSRPASCAGRGDCLPRRSLCRLRRFYG